MLLVVLGTPAYSQIYQFTRASSGAPNMVAANVSGTSLTRGPGVSGANLFCSGLNDGFGSTAWPSTNLFDVATFNGTGDYITFTLTPDVGYGMKITGFSTFSRRENLSGNINDGPIAMRYGFSTDGGGTWTTVNPLNPQNSNLCTSSGVFRCYHVR